MKNEIKLMNNDFLTNKLYAMVNKKRPFDRLFSQLQDVTDEKGRFLNTVLWSKGGDCSVIFEMTNPIEQYATDADLYMLFHDVMSSVVKTLGEGYALQKQDIFCRQKYHHEVKEDAPFLTKRYFAYFEGREYTDIRTFLIITQEAQRGKFVQYDAKRWTEFLTKVSKVVGLVERQGYCAPQTQQERGERVSAPLPCL